MRITISGPPGSGKTTVCHLLSSVLDYPCVISGNIFREMAQEHDLSLEDFGRLAEKDSSFDRMLDERMIDIARENEDIILEGRLVAHMLSRNGIPAFSVFLDADLDERAERVAEREGILPLEAREAILTREESEAKRYLSYYGIDISDRSVYDQIIDSTHITPRKVLDIIMQRLEGEL